MKKLLFLFPLLLVLSLARAQTITNTSAVPHTTGTPSGAPSTYGSWLRYDKTNKILYQWTGAAWTRVVGTVADGDKGSITVSGSGGTWSVDVGEGGIYEGSGTVPASTVATATNGFRMNSGASGQILLGDYGSAGLGGNLNLQGSGAILGTPGYQFRAQADDAYIQMVSPGYTVRLEPTTAYTLIQSGATNGFKFWDVRATPRGVEYSSDYSATYNDRSLVDFGSVKGLISDSLAAGGSPTLQQVALAGNETTLSIIANTVNVKNDNEFAGVIEAGELTVDRTFSLPNRSGFVRVGENYKVYTALLTQSGTSAPVATVLENTLGGTVVWSYTASGDYLATLSGAFTVGKTWMTIVPYGDNGPQGIYSLANISANTVRVMDVNGDNGLVYTPIEIRVYP